MELHDRSFASITEGETFAFTKTITDAMMTSFTETTGDLNPLHTDDAYARSRGFTGRVAHGMLVASLFSSLVGMLCPGKRNLYLSQSLNFRKPVYPKAVVTVRGTVIRTSVSTSTITIRTEILADETVLIDGEALVKVLP